MTTYTITLSDDGAAWACRGSARPGLRAVGATPQEALTDFLQMEAIIEALRREAEMPLEDEAPPVVTAHGG